MGESEKNGSMNELAQRQPRSPGALYAHERSLLSAPYTTCHPSPLRWLSLDRPRRVHKVYAIGG